MAMNSKHLLSVSIFSAALILSVIIFSNAFKNRNESRNTISVTGLAERNFESDLIVWQSQFTVKNMNLTAAYAELKKQSEATRKFLETKGIDKTEMTFSAIEITKEYSYVSSYGNSTSVFDGYRLTQQISITSNDVPKIESISREITELINSGIEITSLPPQYYYTKLADLKIAMLAEASKDGLARAATIAENGNAKLGKLLNSSMGVFQIVAQNSSEDYSWGGSFNTSSKKKTATITVKLQYQVK
jgi:hypothetical protein